MFEAVENVVVGGVVRAVVVVRNKKSFIAPRISFKEGNKALCKQNGREPLVAKSRSVGNLVDREGYGSVGERMRRGGAKAREWWTGGADASRRGKPWDGAAVVRVSLYANLNLRNRRGEGKSLL